MYFGQIKQEKIVFLLFWIKKSFLHQKKKLLNKSKNSKFSKRVSPWFLSKNRTFCHVCLLGKSSQKRSFFGILDKKECFLDQKKEVLKNDKKSTFSKGVSPQFLSKNWTFYHLCFLGKSRQSCLRADVSYFLCCTRKRDVCVTPSLIVFQRPAGREFYFA